jgi:hypothetical protein
MESSCDSRQSPHIYASINMNRRRMLYHLAPQNDPRSETRCSSRAFPSAHRKSVEVGLEVADQFFLLRVNGDDGLLLGLRGNDFCVDVFELGCGRDGARLRLLCD